MKPPDGDDGRNRLCRYGIMATSSWKCDGVALRLSASEDQATIVPMEIDDYENHACHVHVTDKIRFNFFITY